MIDRIVLTEGKKELIFEYDHDRGGLIVTIEDGSNASSQTIKDENLDLFFAYLNRILAKRIASKPADSKDFYLAELLLLAANVKIDSATILGLSSRWADFTQVFEEYSNNAWHRMGFADASSEKVEADVFIGLPQEEIDLFTIERIQNATGDFMEAMGFELETQDEPVFGSFFQRLKYLLKGEVKQEASEIYQKGKVALEAKFIDLPSAEATDKLASAAAGLITSLSGVSDAAIRCGSILLVKVTKDGVPKIVTETVSPELAALLNKNPALLQNPSIVFDLISSMHAPDRTIEEGGNAELAE